MRCGVFELGKELQNWLTVKASEQYVTQWLKKHRSRATYVRHWLRRYLRNRRNMFPDLSAICAHDKNEWNKEVLDHRFADYEPGAWRLEDWA